MSELRLYNTLTKTIDPIVSLDPDAPRLGMYCCGPTVHDYAHIGNFRTFVLSDLLRRYLKFRGYEVRYVMNITDVEDKIIARIKTAGQSLREYTSHYEKAFLDDLEALHCFPPDVMPRATEHMEAIVELIARLVERGIAYVSQEGSVYFSIDRYRGKGCCYGQLAHLDFENMRPGQRVQADEYEKDAVADFALWKARTDADGAVYWPSPWGEGRPGWHVECSAMSMQYLGASFDLHLGGEDLVFPHHEDEIAQSEGAALQDPGQRFVRHWVHGAHLMVEGKKMSKSLGNFFTLRDLLTKGFSGREIRFVLLSAHYRETFNFTLDGLQAARTALGRLDGCLTKLKARASREQQVADPSPSLLDAVTQALDDDLNVSAAWAAVFEWVREMNRLMGQDALTPQAAASALAAWEAIDAFLGLGHAEADDDVPEDVQRMVEQRQQARQNRDFALADQFRDQLKALGWGIEDSPEGPVAKRLS